MRISDWSSDVCSSDLMEHKNKKPREVAARELNTDIVISPQVPPTLLVHAKDDTVDPVHYSEVYARELRNAGVDVTLNIYETGGHAFGVSKQGTDTDRWMDDALEWLKKKGRSEEHTSELQSLMRISYAVFCLKKKKQKLKHTTT